MSNNKISAIVNCECCGKEISFITTYQYKWNEKTPVENKIEPVNENWEGQRVITLVNRQYQKHYGHVYKKKGMNFLCKFHFKFNGLLIDGNSERHIYFNDLKCSDCIEKTLEDVNSFEYLINERFTEDKIKKLHFGGLDGLQIIKEKKGPVMDMFGCITFGYTTIHGYSLAETERAVEKFMKEIFKCEFDYVYSYTEELNPDRDGIYVIIRPTKIL